jgi:hypothetical protein
MGSGAFDILVVKYLVKRQRVVEFLEQGRAGF